MTEDFLNYLRYERNRSELTVRRYEQGLRDFERTSKIEIVSSRGSR